VRWSRRTGMGPERVIERLRTVLDESVDGVESMVSYVRSLAEPIHDLLDEANALAGGIRRTVDSARPAGEALRRSEERYVPSMAPPGMPPS
jgi:hypothetical protein